MNLFQRAAKRHKGVITPAAVSAENSNVQSSWVVTLVASSRAENYSLSFKSLAHKPLAFRSSGKPTGRKLLFSAFHLNRAKASPPLTVTALCHPFTNST
jgi:hypothetical protein